VKKWIATLALAALVLHFPATVAAALGLAGTIAVTAAAQPTVWAFAAGLLAYPRIARRWAR
jgi:hypothetical protein